MWEYIAEDSLILITIASSLLINILVNVTRVVFRNVIGLDTHRGFLEKDFRVLSLSLSLAASAINVARERHFFRTTMK